MVSFGGGVLRATSVRLRDQRVPGQGHNQLVFTSAVFGVQSCTFP